MKLRLLIVCCFLQSTFGRSTLHENLKKFKSDLCCSSYTKCTTEISYPKCRRDESVIDDYYGIKVADPYRWLEDVDSKETKQFVEAQNEISDKFLRNCNEWQRIKDKLQKLSKYPEYYGLEQHGNNYFSYMTDPDLDDQFVLYKQQSLDEKPSIFLDPTKLSSSNDTLVMLSMGISHDEKLMAYSLTNFALDKNIIKVRDIETGEDYPDLLQNTSFSYISWTHDNQGFFYTVDFTVTESSEEADDDYVQHIYYHRFGEPQELDVFVAEMPGDVYFILSKVSDCGRYLIVTTYTDEDENLVFYADLEQNGEINGKIELTPIIGGYNGEYEYITNIGSKIIFHTNKNAPNYRLIVVDVEHPEEENWTTLVEEHSTDILEAALCAHNDKLILSYVHEAKSVLQVHSIETGELIQKIPVEIGNLFFLGGNPKYSELFFGMESFLSPGVIYRYDLEQPDNEPTVFHETPLNLDNFDRTKFQIEQVSYTSYDGTPISMYLVQKKIGTKGPKPTLLYGYGGFEAAMQPSFEPSWLLFVNLFDGILAIPNIRGNGDQDTKWDNGKRLINNQNSYNDFLAAAEYLIDNKYTDHKRLAIAGASNGGLLIGACINQRPDLFGAAAVGYGLLDLMRHNFTDDVPLEFGHPGEKPHFKHLRKFSPLNNVHTPNSTRSQYPATLIVTTDEFDSISPSHSYKFAAELQYAVRDNQFQKNPILLKVYSDPDDSDESEDDDDDFEDIEEDTDMLMFLYKAIHVKAKI